MPRDTAREECPICEGYIVTKDGKFGKFKGCTRWPKCNYTESIYSNRYDYPDDWDGDDYDDYYYGFHGDW